MLCCQSVTSIVIIYLHFLCSEINPTNFLTAFILINIDWLQIRNVTPQYTNRLQLEKNGFCWLYRFEHSNIIGFVIGLNYYDLRMLLFVLWTGFLFTYRDRRDYMERLDTKRSSRSIWTNSYHWIKLLRWENLEMSSQQIHSKRKIMLFICGSFNPPTLMHFRMFCKVTW